MRLSYLDNGLPILTDRQPGRRAVAMGLLIDACPADDPLGQAGLAHLTEHALFTGTQTRDSLALARMMDSAGGQMGGFVNREYTCLYANVVDDFSTFALELLGDILLNTRFDDDAIAREQSAITHEIGLKRDRADDVVQNLLKQSMWSTHALGRPVEGRPAEVAQLTARDVRRFVAEHYRTGRMILAASGDLNHELFVAQAQDAFWRLPTGVGEPCRAAAGPVFQPGLSLAAADVAQAYFSLAIPLPGYADPLRYGLHVVNAALGGSMSSRLFRRLREEAGCVYAVSSEIHAYRPASALVIEGATAPERLVEAISIAIMELLALATGEAPLDDEELWTARQQLVGQQLLAGENAHTRMSRLLTQQFYFGHPLDEAELVAAVREVDHGVIKQVLEQRLLPVVGHPAMAVVGPQEWLTIWEDPLRELGEGVARLVPTTA